MTHLLNVQKNKKSFNCFFNPHGLRRSAMGYVPGRSYTGVSVVVDSKGLRFILLSSKEDAWHFQRQWFARREDYGCCRNLCYDISVRAVDGEERTDDLVGSEFMLRECHSDSPIRFSDVRVNLNANGELFLVVVGSQARAFSSLDRDGHGQLLPGRDGSPDIAVLHYY